MPYTFARPLHLWLSVISRLNWIDAYCTGLHPHAAHCDETLHCAQDACFCPKLHTQFALEFLAFFQRATTLGAQYLEKPLQFLHDGLLGSPDWVGF